MPGGIDFKYYLFFISIHDVLDYVKLNKNLLLNFDITHIFVVNINKQRKEIIKMVRKMKLDRING